MPRPSASDWNHPVFPRPRDPFLLRIGLLVGGIALLVPLALIVRPTTDGGSRVETDGLAGAVVVLQPGAAAGSAPESSVGPAGAVVAADAPPSTFAAFTAGPGSVVANAVEAAPVPPSTVPPTTEAPSTSAPRTTAAVPAVTIAVATTTTIACGQNYEIVGGDSWSGIASGYGVSLGDLLGANGASAATPIYPGDDICLPPGAQRRTTTTVAKPATTKAPSTTKAPTTTVAAATTVATPAPTAAPTTTVPSRSYSAAEIEEVIRSVWPDDLEDRALEIAWRESNYRPTARNSCCYGLFQINWNSHKSWLDDWGITSASQLYDPTVNAQVALGVYNRAGGWGPWGG